MASRKLRVGALSVDSTVFFLPTADKLFLRAARLAERRGFGRGGNLKEALLVVALEHVVGFELVFLASVAGSGCTDTLVLILLVANTTGDSVLACCPTNSRELGVFPNDEILARRALRRLLVGVSSISITMLLTAPAGDDSRLDVGDSLFPRAERLARRVPRLRFVD